MYFIMSTSIICARMTRINRESDPFFSFGTPYAYGTSAESIEHTLYVTYGTIYQSCGTWDNHVKACEICARMCGMQNLHTLVGGILHKPTCPHYLARASYGTVYTNLQPLDLRSLTPFATPNPCVHGNPSDPTGMFLR